MVKANVHDVKVHFSKYLSEVEKGATVLVCKRNVPVAEIRPIPHESKTPRRLDVMKGVFRIDESFFEPLPHDLLDLFEGKGS